MLVAVGPGQVEEHFDINQVELELRKTPP